MRWPWRRAVHAEPRPPIDWAARAQVDAADGTADLHVTERGLVARYDITGPGDTARVVIDIPVRL